MFYCVKRTLVDWSDLHLANNVHSRYIHFPWKRIRTVFRLLLLFPATLVLCNRWTFIAPTKFYESSSTLYVLRPAKEIKLPAPSSLKNASIFAVSNKTQFPGTHPLLNIISCTWPPIVPTLNRPTRRKTPKRTFVLFLASLLATHSTSALYKFVLLTNAVNFSIHCLPHKFYE